MASRAATLVKPKPAKAKANMKAGTGKLVAKNSTAKADVALKSSATALKRPASKLAMSKPVSSKAISSKAIASKALPAKSSISKTPLSKPKMLKTIAAKPAATKTVKPTSTTLTIKPKAALAEKPIAIAGAASFETAAPKPRRRTKGEIRTRIYWAVFNQSLRRVAVFEFDQRDEAEKRAARLTKANGEHHFLQKIKAIVQ